MKGFEPFTCFENLSLFRKGPRIEKEFFIVKKV